MAKTAKSKSPEPAPPTVVDDAAETPPRARPTEEEIAVRAYHIYLERDGLEGDPADDWLQAERELNDAFEQGA